MERQTLAQWTEVSDSDPNFNGIRVSTGIKYKATPETLISVRFTEAEDYVRVFEFSVQAVHFLR